MKYRKTNFKFIRSKWSKFRSCKNYKGQKWTFLYDSKELTDYIVWEVQKWRKIEEILLDEQVNDTIVEIKWGIVEKYESDLEKYLDNLNDDNLTEDQVKAKELVYDIHWFGYTNIKEINWDITKQAWWTLAAIWAWIWSLIWCLSNSMNLDLTLSYSN